MIIFDIIFSLVFLYVTGTTLYLVILTVAAYLFRKKAGDPDPGLRVAVVIPAHNEALQIEATIRSVLDSRYPGDRYDIFVIADNCGDDTAELAEKAGARAVERVDPVNRGKGQALDWFFRTQEKLYGDFDAVAVIDADTFPDPDFLAEISASLSQPGVSVVQGFYGVANPRDGWRTALAAAALNVFHHVRPAGRNRINGSAGLKGNGMAFRTGILKKYGWPAYSIVEDIEFSMLLLKDDILVDYNPDAIVYGEMAAERKQAETQRRRWEGGRLQIFKRYAPSLLGLWLSGRRMRYLDGFMELATPPLSLLVMGQLLVLAVSAIFYPGLTGVGWVFFPGIVFYVFSGQILRKAPLYVWGCLLAAPLFILWKVPVYLKIIKNQDKETWKRTKRQAEMRKKDR